jgi:hypothetical protein
MPSYIPPQGARKKGYGVFPPQGVKVKPVVPPAPPPPPPPPPPEVYVDVLDSGIGYELVDVSKVAFEVEHGVISVELSTQSYDVEGGLANSELIFATPEVEHDLVTMELKFPA